MWTWITNTSESYYIETYHNPKFTGKYIRGYLKATAHYAVEELKKMGFVGVYMWKEEEVVKA